MKEEIRALQQEAVALGKNVVVLGATGVASATAIGLSKSATKDIIDKKGREERKKIKKRRAGIRKRSVEAEKAQAKKLAEETGAKIPVSMRMDWIKRQTGASEVKVPMFTDIINGTVDNGPKIAKTSGKLLGVGALAIVAGAIGNDSKARVKESLESCRMIKNISKELYRQYSTEEDED